MKDIEKYNETAMAKAGPLIEQFIEPSWLP
jgi:hypothetical protein